MIRPDYNHYFMNIAYAVSIRSTCIRRKTGAVIVDLNNFIIATGYNGVAKGMPHCNQLGLAADISLDIYERYPYACSGSRSASGEDLDNCEAIHAEQNALLQCSDVHSIAKVYLTTSPCITCAKLLMSTSCLEVFYSEEYPHIDRVRSLLADKGIELIQINPSDY